MTLPKVVFVIDHFKNPGAGTEGQLMRLVQGYLLAGGQAHLLVLQDSEFLASGRFPCAYSVVGHSRILGPKTWLACWRHIKQLKRQGFSVFHVFFNDSSILFPPLVRMARAHCLISRRDMGYWYTPSYLRILRVTGRFVSGVVVNSNAVGKITSASEGIPEHKIHVIYNGYEDFKVLDEPPHDLGAFKRSGEVLLGLVANIRPIKRMQDAILAVAYLRRKGLPVKLVIVGDGDTSELQKLAIQHEIDAYVLFAGGRQDVPSCLKVLDIALLCSESEGFSNAIIEYMQAGLPVVCTETGGNPEAITDGVTGRLYPVADVSALAACLEPLIRDESLRQRMGHAAQIEATRRFAIQAMLNAHLDLYQKLEAS